MGGPEQLHHLIPRRRHRPFALRLYDGQLCKVMMVVKEDEDRQKSREAGFNSHIVKPVDHAELMNLLASLSSEQTGRITKH